MTFLIALVFFLTSTYPQTSLYIQDRHNVIFKSHVIAYDPGHKYRFVLHDVKTIPTWLFNIQYRGKKINEAWKHELHNGIICNVINNNQILLHLKTVGVFSTDIVFLLDYYIVDNGDDIVIFIFSNSSYFSQDVNDFKMKIKIMPHPTQQNMVIIDANGYIKSSFSVGWIPDYIKWQIDALLQNFGARMIEVLH